MHPGRIHNTTHTLKGNGETGVGDLPVRVEDRTYAGPRDEPFTLRFLTSAWYPTPEELERLVKGAPVLLEVMERRAPAPVQVMVGEPPEEDNPYPAGDLPQFKVGE